MEEINKFISRFETMKDGTRRNIDTSINRRKRMIEKRAMQD